jgi:DNA-binding NarL/FixJ family response regulator
MSEIKVILVDDHQIILDSLKLLINLMDNISVVSTINDPRPVETRINEDKPELIIMDYSMPYINGLELSMKLKMRYPDINIILLSVKDDPATINHAYKVGCSGFLMKSVNREELETAIRTVSKGDMYYSPQAMQLIMAGEDVSAIDESDYGYALTKREKEIIHLIVQELSTIEIAQKLNISPGTVETHRYNIMRKLKVKNVVGITKFALKAGLVND